MLVSLSDSGCFYLANIFLAALGTALTSTMIIIQQMGHLSQEVPERIKRIFMVYLGPSEGMRFFERKLHDTNRRGNDIQRQMITILW